MYNMKKIILIIAIIVVLCGAAFGITAYSLNNTVNIEARAFLNNTGTVSYNGSMKLKINFDTDGLAQKLGVSDNPDAVAQINLVKNEFESSLISLTFDGMNSDKKTLLNGKYTLPEELGLGPSSGFNVYTDGTDVWAKMGGSGWTKQNSQSSSLSPEDEKASSTAALDFLKSCPVTDNGKQLTITMKPGYEDIKKMIPAKTLDEINKQVGSGLKFEDLFNSLSMQAAVTIDKNTSFFIPNPSISKVDIQMTGNLSKMLANVKDIPDETKLVLEAMSFTASGTIDVKKDASLQVQKPEGI